MRRSGSSTRTASNTRRKTTTAGDAPAPPAPAKTKSKKAIAPGAKPPVAAKKKSISSQSKVSEGSSFVAPSAEPPKPAPPVAEGPKVHRVALKAFADFVLKDPMDLWKSSGKWPLIIDETDKIHVFLHFQNALELDVAFKEEMEDPEGVIRVRVLNSIRYGHYLMLILHGVQNLEMIRDMLDEAQPDLWADLFSKKIMEEETYLKLVRPSDGEQYEDYHFGRVKDFVFIPIVTYNKERPPHPFLLANCIPFQIYNPDAPKPKEAEVEPAGEE